jgi:hypothetical protein
VLEAVELPVLGPQGVGGLARDGGEEVGQECRVRVRRWVHKLGERMLTHGLANGALEVGYECEMEVDIRPRADVPLACSPTPVPSRIGRRR